MSLGIETVPGRYAFLLVGRTMGTQWSQVLQQALLPLGKLHIVPQDEAVPAVIQSDYDVIIIDAGEVRDAALLASRLRARWPEARVVIATASPTWRRAREALRAGATDYIRKSLDEEELRSKIQAVLDAPPPSGPN
jgi:DNA-binding NarL/FixJ family response regulator